ncbi:hypothetical protein [Streptomyces sp. NPDC005799]|uniref:hypothetical protein n=1 Tax=Streptomyces sp. NPDC005799 TaxID=3154678 RepID=UPI0034079B99
MATEVVRYTGARVWRGLRTEPAAGQVAGLRAFLALWRKIVVDSDFRTGCPVLAMCRAKRGIQPLDDTAEQLQAVGRGHSRSDQLLQPLVAFVTRPLKVPVPVPA